MSHALPIGDLMPMDGKEEQKQVIKEALKEWLDEKFILFGKCSFSAVAAAAFVALTYFILISQGWKK